MSKQEKMLETVRALLAKAEATEFPEEAEAFRAKADSLMTKWAIEQWQVQAAQDGVGGRLMPIRKNYDFSWYSGEFKQDMWRLFCRLGTHCRVQVVTAKTLRMADGRKIPVLGLQSDVDYMDMLFTHLMLDLASKINPKPLAKLSYEENLANLKECGLGWPEIARLMHDAGMMEYKVITEDDKSHLQEFRDGKPIYDQKPILKPWDHRPNYAKPAHDYRRWCKKTGHPQAYTDYRTYRNAFAVGYVDAVEERLSIMRRAQRKEYDAGHKAGGMELVVKDIKDMIKEFMFEEFPDMRPHPPECECATCHYMKCRDLKCQRPMCVQGRKPVRYRAEKQGKVDFAAMDAGREAGKKVRLDNGAANVSGGKNKEIS